MGKTLILTFIARDKPGLVERLSGTVAQEDGNWLESRMVHLAEKFAGVARIEISGDKVEDLKTALSALDTEGFHLTIEEAKDTVLPDGPVLNLELVGPDQPGILRDISHCLAAHGVSVEEMDTDIRGAPMGGGTFFYAWARVRVPAHLSENALRQALEALAGALMVDITLGDAAPVAA
jgi:glycine cleavage system regulatory protein